LSPVRGRSIPRDLSRIPPVLAKIGGILIPLTPLKQQLIESARHSYPDIIPWKNDTISLV
ncbi:hypothetical protein, partial [Phormidium sp. CCY1219]|uniref:hypothetical protein n=1 Tax=Phormidium sp. CCY1219 TaxID=2886104 RepID=UPI002D1F7031